MPILASADWLILLIYCFFVLSAGMSLAPAMTGSREYLQAGRKLPGWLCGLALVSASMGSLEVLGMGAAGAKYGLASMGFFALGSIPAMLFAALVLMPVFYGAVSAPGAPVRSIPEYLGLRFDQKTRALNAVLFTAMALFSAGISLYAMARVVAALHVFDTVADRLNLPPTGALLLTMALPAAMVLAYALLGGMAAVMYNQLLQFCVMVAGLLPVVLLGLKRVGGWSGLKAADSLTGAAHTGTHSLGMVGLVVGVGLVLGGGTWCTDFRLLQTAMAAKNAAAARRAPLVAASLRIFVPLLLVLPGLLALGLPTPHTTIVIHNENGAIYHEITVVPPAVEAGQGMVPAKADAAGQPVKGADGKSVLDYAMATPNMLPQFLPTGLLGLGLAALLACLMSGVAASLTASNTVFACDIYQAFLKKRRERQADFEGWPLGSAWRNAAGLWRGLCCHAVNDLLDAVVLIFAVVNAPLFATLLLGALWKRATGHGAFAGLIAGIVAALLHHGTALPQGEQPGIHGGWIKVLHHPASDMALGLGTAVLAFAVSLLVTAAVSVCTAPRDPAELAGLVRAPETSKVAWWKRPETVAAAVILLAAIAVNVMFL